MRELSVLTTAVALIVTSIAPVMARDGQIVQAASAPAPLGPESWIGTYAGTWKSGPREEGDFTLVIERVEGDRVFGTRTTTHPGRRDSRFGTFTVTGSVSGDTLTLEGAHGQAILTRSGTELTGTGWSSATSTLTLRKVK
jgi:hypothetical protein